MSLLLFDTVDIRINVRLSFVRRQSWVLEMHLNAKLNDQPDPPPALLQPLHRRRNTKQKRCEEKQLAKLIA